MTDDELKAIEERCSAATAGPWAESPGLEVCVWASGLELIASCHGRGYERHGQWPEFQVERNAQFIASARTNVAALLAEVRRLRSAPHYSTEAVDALLDCYDGYCESDDTTPRRQFWDCLEAVRASREPKP